MRECALVCDDCCGRYATKACENTGGRATAEQGNDRRIAGFGLCQRDKFRGMSGAAFHSRRGEQAFR